MADKYIIYANESEFLKQREHLDKLARADGWKEETVADLTIGPKCTHVRDAIAAGTFESSGLAEKILHRHVIYPIAADDGVRVATRVPPELEKYDGDTDPLSADKFDLKTAVAELPADWAPELAAAEEKVIK